MTRNILHPIVVLALVTGLAAAAAQAAEGKQLYRWVDEKGQVHYGDRVPASSAKQGRESMKNGVVTKVIPRELTGPELEREQARQAAAKVAEDARQQRIAHDKYLLQSFASVADLQDAREMRLTSLDARITLAAKAVEDNEKTLADLRARAGSKLPEGPLKMQIETFEGSLIDNLQAVRKLRDERTATATRYTADIERFKGLRAGTIQQGD